MKFRKLGIMLVILSYSFYASSQGVGSFSVTSSAVPHIDAENSKPDFSNAEIDEGESSVGPAFSGALNTPQGQVALAMVTPEYPVTPGDIYTLSFITANGSVTSSVLVDSECIVSISNLGKVNARGMRFLDLRKDVEKRVLAAYPLSAPQLIIQRCGAFTVFVKGEVVSSEIVYAWGLQRLSSLWGGLTPYASKRDVLIKRSGSPDRKYDLFIASRTGDLTQDPYLQPNDIVVFSRYSRLVTLSGAVKRPGNYQLLLGEGLDELISVYGEGLLETAQPEVAKIVRRSSIARKDGAVIAFSYSKGKSDLPAIIDGDAVSIPATEDFLPVIYFEGAIATGTEVAKQYATDRQPFRRGELLSRALQTVASRISPGADLKRAFIARKGESVSIPVNLERILYAYDPKEDVELKAEDRIIIPFGSLDVFVTGEVTKSSWVNASSLTRLRDVVTPLITRYSSLRDVNIRGESGEESTYDLFKADRYGNLDQDPFVKPGDIITVRRVERSVAIAGQVKRPGSYQLLPGEGLWDLVNLYAEGPLPSARADYASLTRLASDEKPEGESLFFDASVNALEKKEGQVQLMDGDSVFVPNRESYLPVVYFEGAISTGVTVAAVTASGSDKAAPIATVRQYATDRQVFKPGDKLSRAIRSEAAAISPGADLKRAFIVRKSDSSPRYVDLERLLYAYEPSLDVELEAEDRIVIPYGSLDVFVTGEVTKSSWVNAGALMRLSSLVAPCLTKYSSVRDIEVTDSNGKTASYDLFKADRYGDLGQDPFVKSGDMIRVKPFLRSVSVDGEVRRPGTYQLLEGENLKDLIELYAMGFTEQANLERLSLVRYIDSGVSADNLGEKRLIDYTKEESLYLNNFDAINVHSSKELLPCIYFEGALGVGVNGEDPQAARRQVYTFYPGESLSQATQKLRTQFSAVSDLAKAYVKRGETRIAVDLGKYLYEKDFSSDIALVANDVVIIPFRQFFVSISGAVETPGRYPYVPDRDWAYYVNLAGGINKDKNTGDVLRITDVHGKPYGKDRVIQPEDIIYVESNSLLYLFGKVSSILSTVISVTALVISIVKLVQ